jgi:F0F1-type ATP synthase membrane subunit b/b'
MESIFAHLDLNVVGLLWHSANFLLLLAALWWLFFRPITRLLDAREQRVRESLIRAEDIDKQAVVAEAERSALLAAAHAEARAIRARAEGQADRLLIRSRAMAREEAQRVAERAAGTVNDQSAPSDDAVASVVDVRVPTGTADAGALQRLARTPRILPPVGQYPMHVSHNGASR